MPKLKKAAKNAYYFYVMEKKEEAESREGRRYTSNFQQLSQMFGRGWSSMTKEEKAPYDEIAKENKKDEKFNIDNKFTVTGESYAQLHRKKLDEGQKLEQMEMFISDITTREDSMDRNYVIVKAVYHTEEIVSKKEKLYWPSEISLAAFSLRGGLQAVYTQLVDTGTVPTGYASQAKENALETLIPLPGDTEVFGDDCRDYMKIIKQVNGFLNHWLTDGYVDVPGHRKVIFCLDPEAAPIVGCLRWLVNRLEGRERRKYETILDNLKVYKLPKLIVSMGEFATMQNPDYDNYLVRYKLDPSAEAIISKGNYDYREEIACWFHRSEKGNMKMVNCAQSIVVRRILMLFEEFVPGYKLCQTYRHQIGDRLGKRAPGPPRLKKTKQDLEEEVVVAEPTWMKDEDDGVEEPMDTTENDSFPFREGQDSWDRRRPPAEASFMSDDFPSLMGDSTSRGSASGGRGRGSSSAASFNHSAWSAAPPLNTNRHNSAQRPQARSILEDVDDDDEFPTLQSVGRGRGRAR